MLMQWRVCLYNGRVETHRTEMRTTRVTDVRHKAKATAQELLSGAATGHWTRSSNMDDYIRKVSIDAVERNQFPRPLRPNTQTKYIQLLELLARELRGMAISDAVRPGTLAEALANIATEHGTVTARQVAKVSSKHVMRRLVTDEIIDHNPLREMELELPEHVAKKKPKGGQALTPEERARVVEWLLAADTHVAKGRGRYTAEQKSAKRRLAVDVTLVQATCGMRINEVCSLTGADVTDGDPMTLRVTEEVSKTHKGRTVPVMDERVAERVRARLGGPADLVFGAPCAEGETWDKSNRQKALKALYKEMAAELDISLLGEVGTHVWRATLNTEWMMKGVPDALRAAHLGHGVDVNLSTYTDTSSTEQLVSMLR